MSLPTVSLVYTSRPRGLLPTEEGRKGALSSISIQGGWEQWKTHTFQAWLNEVPGTSPNSKEGMEDAEYDI